MSRKGEQETEPSQRALAASHMSHGVRLALGLLHSLAARGFRGLDPYDGLNAPVASLLPRHPKLPRRLLVQTVKRCPIALEPVLRVPPTVNSYTLGHVLLACARLRQPAGPSYVAEVAADVLKMLEAAAVDTKSGTAWGYPFPVAVRFTEYPRGFPNIVATSYVAKGLYAVHSTGLADCSDRLRAVAEFILDELPTRRSSAGASFGYTPSFDGIIHNANALAAQTLGLASIATGTEHYREVALSAASFTASYQRAGGYWPYAEGAQGSWVDSFHTGFTLEGLSTVAELTASKDLQESVAKGLRFYVARFFGPHGEPAYYADGSTPYDALAAAQGIETLYALRCRGVHTAQALRLLLGWTYEHMIDADDWRVAYQLHAHWTDWRQFPRWSIAPMMSALAQLDVEAGADS